MVYFIGIIILYSILYHAIKNNVLINTILRYDLHECEKVHRKTDMHIVYSTRIDFALYYAISAADLLLNC